jgi:predicted aminopeptidase
VKPRKIYWRATSTEEETRRVSKQPGLGKVLLPAALLIALLQSGCGGPYVFQQGLGQLDISVNRVPLDDESLQASLDEAQRGRMSWIPRVIEFARDELGLEPGDSYTSYFDTGGGSVSYTVVASHPLALIPYQWCFPFIGCVPYKGYFDPEDARAEALALREAGWDAEVFPVAAYSTLGWFSDPLLSGMLSLSMPELVELLLHELTHRTLYIPSRSQLNEGFATHMGREGARLFFQRHPEAASRDELDEYHRAIERDSQYSELISRLCAGVGRQAGSPDAAS